MLAIHIVKACLPPLQRAIALGVEGQCLYLFYSQKLAQLLSDLDNEYNGYLVGKDLLRDTMPWKHFIVILKLS